MPIEYYLCFSLEQEVMERTLAQEIEDSRVADTHV